MKITIHKQKVPANSARSFPAIYKYIDLDYWVLLTTPANGIVLSNNGTNATATVGTFVEGINIDSGFWIHQPNASVTFSGE